MLALSGIMAADRLALVNVRQRPVERRTRAASTSAHSTQQPRRDAEPHVRTANVRFDGSAGRGGRRGHVEPPTPIDHPGRGLGRAPPSLSKKHSPLRPRAPARDGRKNMENISPGSFRYGKAAAAPGRFDRVVEKPDHMPPRHAGIGAPSLELRQDLLSSAATISAFRCRARPTRAGRTKNERPRSSDQAGLGETSRSELGGGLSA